MDKLFHLREVWSWDQFSHMYAIGWLRWKEILLLFCISPHWEVFRSLWCAWCTYIRRHTYQSTSWDDPDMVILSPLGWTQYCYLPLLGQKQLSCSWRRLPISQSSLSPSFSSTWFPPSFLPPSKLLCLLQGRMLPSSSSRREIVFMGVSELGIIAGKQGGPNARKFRGT